MAVLKRSQKEKSIFLAKGKKLSSMMSGRTRRKSTIIKITEPDPQTDRPIDRQTCRQTDRQIRPWSQTSTDSYA